MTSVRSLTSGQGSIPCPQSADLRPSMTVELGVWLALLVISNLHLLGISDPTALVFFPRAVIGGEYWRLFTHAWAHVSSYHLLLDATAFLSLYHALGRLPRAARLGGMLASLFGSVLIAWWASPEVAILGLCGLSGTAHGLMALVCLQRIKTTAHGSWESCIFAAALVGVVAKCLIEILAGGALLASWHFGLIGTPIVICHAGGLLGALAFWSARHLR